MGRKKVKPSKKKTEEMKTDIIEGSKEDVFKFLKKKMDSQDIVIVSISYFYDKYSENQKAIVIYHE